MTISTFLNIDLLTVGITIAAIGILGFLILLSNKKSITNRSFFLFSILTILYGVINYISYKVPTADLTLLTTRLVIFSALLHAYSLFQLIYVFPLEKVTFSKKYKFVILPVVILSALLTLTPFVFVGLSGNLAAGDVPVVQKGPGLIIFVLVILFLVIRSVYTLLIKFKNSKNVERDQLGYILSGILFTFTLILVFNFIFPLAFNIVRFVPLAPVFFLPFIIFTSFAIYKHKLFNIKVAATALLAFLVTVFSFINIIFSSGTSGIVINVTAFIIILIGSIRLVRDMLRLEEANSRLRDLDRQKSEFVSFASHQLRSPLTAMKGYASLIIEGDYGPITADMKEAVSRIYESSNTLATVVDDYLNISRIELGSMKYNFKDIDARELVENIIAEQKPNIQKAGLKIDFNVFHNDSYKISADPDKFKQVITNIIDNSVKYTPKGSITVAVERKDDKILFSVKDTGIGISKATIAVLFDKFTRANNANEVNIRGTGLGLYIAKQIVIAHNGRVWVESEGEGKGSQFYVEVPRKV